MLAKNTDEVIQYLDNIIAEAIAERSRRGFFAALYRQVTLKVKIGIKHGFFDDSARMEEFTTQFANRYFRALDDYQKNIKSTRSWQLTFDAVQKPDLLILQHLLLAINSHINLDLGIVAAKLCPGEKIHTLRDDFIKINAILNDLLEPTEMVLGQMSPLIEILDRFGGRKDEIIFNFSIRKARQAAWNHAKILAYQTPEIQQDIITVIDSKVSFLGRAIANPNRTFDRVVELIKKSESDDTVAIINALNTIVK
ncbi:MULTISPECIES: DUF5995 family protein [Calothrix]|uniref:Uncharacterized protein n=2 Tax=Calothrix TaxID=1186 RepID=A0ABR8A200_9CYAN|nr:MULTISPECIES: DUF5995 family protein [Calothrix]MBD2193937.1 hypothetical protein [Calothrix parietina FACHB-288]MBD2222944.1 hypothetical protein [Calothrix anomala FACHB-343]